MPLHAAACPGEQLINVAVESLERIVDDHRMPDNPDPAFAALLDDPRSALRPPRQGSEMAVYRARIDAPMAAVSGSALPSVETLDRAVTGLRSTLRLYCFTPSPRDAILFVHGGGFVVGSLDSHDAMCRSIAVASGVMVVAVDYRLAPEYPYPAGRNDVLAAWRWLMSQGCGRVALCGDSAGGYLAVVAAVAGRGQGMSAAALSLLYPAVDPACHSASWDLFGVGHLLTRDWMRWAWTAVGEPDALTKLDLTGLPPTLVVTAGCDPLGDEGIALVDALRLSGVSVRHARIPGMIHGFASLPTLTPQAETTINRVAEHLSQHMR
ncbi:acetyl esterase [Sphingomonas jinjuensis]|uniref:Acetyl esterase n=1 Tax=Sphingomonas jinjuensis TaxID=535907 RepID=A0A840FGC3_9SPHN|nr:alpha/beta hydrolase [Sphingomonas jinjuensis]MBB4155722.1 acetyl esterase [Sphingomonas jinjuensis]